MKINKKRVKYILLLIPYFELYTFTMLVEKGIYPAFFTLIESLFSLSRTLVSSFYFINMFKSHIRRNELFSEPRILIALFLVSFIVTTTLNGTMSIFYILGIYNYAGFSLLCLNLMKKDMPNFLISGLKLFGILSFIGCFTIFIFPMGFFYASQTDYAVYFLGGKNSAIYYYLLFLLFYSLCISKNVIKVHYGFLTIIFVAMCISVVITRSSNSLVCLAISAIYLLGIYKSKIIQKILSPKIVIITVVVLFFIIVFHSSGKFMTIVLSILGKSSNYTGRTILWEQAFEMIAAHPFIGVGLGVTFTIYSYFGDTVYPQAHSFYLDTMAKHGVFPILILIIGMIYVLNKIYKTARDKSSTDIIVFTAIIMIHSIFDAIEIYYFILLISMCESISLSSLVSFQKKKSLVAQEFRQ